MTRAALSRVLLGVLGASLAACGSDDPCDGVSGPCIGLSSGASQAEVQTAMIEIEAGGTIAFGGGTFSFESDLSLDVDNVTVRGAGMEKTILSFAGQTTGAQGMLVTADNFLIEDIAFEDSPGDALKVLGAKGVTMRRVRVEWTGGPKETNGAYGLYPVQCENVLIEDSSVEGASDAGIYVGQSKKIIVRNNIAKHNVAGIEIENSFDADVTKNTATANTGGILVFNLPDLQVENGARTRVFENELYENNTANFAPAGNIVGTVPAGTGIALLAAHGVEIFNNTIRDHLSINIGIISYTPIGTPNDAGYDIYTTAINIHDNRISGTANMPTGPLGGLIITALGEIAPGAPLLVPDIAWDGVADPARAGMPAERICIKGNGDADFINLAWPLADAGKPTREMAPHDCTLAPLPAVEL